MLLTARQLTEPPGRVRFYTDSTRLMGKISLLRSESRLSQRAECWTSTGKASACQSRLTVWIPAHRILGKPIGVGHLAAVIIEARPVESPSILGMCRWAFRSSMTDDARGIILALIGQLETTVLGLKQLRGYIGPGAGRELIEELIEEGEHKLAELKRKLIQ